MTLIVLDPGHGGDDPGAVGSGLLEKDLTLDIARKTREALGEYLAEVRLTREEDADVTLEARAGLANRLGAGYFLSIHINAGGGTGFESYVYTGAGDTSKLLRRVIHEQVALFYRSAGFVDRGEKSANFAVLRQSSVPAALLENLFIDHPADGAKLASAEFRAGLGRAIAGGLAAALNLTARPAWDPVSEIAGLRRDGLINSDHAPEETLAWGVFAAVLNRYRKKSQAAGPWEPAAEIAKLKNDGLVKSDHAPGQIVSWGELATVLNRLRGRSGEPWDPAAEIARLQADGLINSPHQPDIAVNWGEFATVFNRLRSVSQRGG
ncbi:MAG: N-acetylmuramoyl-L-alanine amidase [Firmicutes bacterium]|nr:N-acetylmuramoyl-L-alanine amidase [Bacillota bacterium]